MKQRLKLDITRIDLLLLRDLTFYLLHSSAFNSNLCFYNCPFKLSNLMNTKIVWTFSILSLWFSHRNINMSTMWWWWSVIQDIDSLLMFNDNMGTGQWTFRDESSSVCDMWQTNSTSHGRCVRNTGAMDKTPALVLVLSIQDPQLYLDSHKVNMFDVVLTRKC